MTVSASEIFFFQAEDGIRDSSVTGVQTCALPIWERNSLFFPLNQAVVAGLTLPQNNGLVEGKVNKELRSLMIVPCSSNRNAFSLTPEIGRASCRERV